MSFPRYESYKDSGVEWLGEVPGHWEVMRVKHVLTVLTDYTANGSFASLAENVTYLSDGYSRLVRLTDLRNNLDNVGLYVDEQAHNFLSKSELFGGEILIANVGAYSGYVCLMPNINQKATLGPNMYLMRFDKCRTSNPFLLMALSSIYMKEQLLLVATSTAQPKLNKDDVKNCVLALPCVNEQQMILAFLDRETAKIDALIAEQQRLIGLLKEKRQAVVSHAVTKGLNPDAPMKDSGIEWLSEVPEHWEICHLKRKTIKITDGSHISPETESGVYEFVSTKDVRDDGIDFENCLRTSKQSYEYLVRTGCKPSTGDVLFSKDGTIGRTVVVREDRDFVVASSLIIIKPNGEAIAPDFLNYLCQSSIVFGQVESFVKGAGLPRLSIQNLLRIVGIFPPIAEQIQIVDYLNLVLDQMASLLASAQDAITLLQERRTALISAAVTGKIDVRSKPIQETLPCP